MKKYDYYRVMDRVTREFKPLIFTTLKRAETYLKGNGHGDLTIIKCNFLAYHGIDKINHKGL